MQKQLILASRVRTIPKQFSWIDHRLVREGYIGRCHAQALGLYLFLVTVGDAQGLSYYADASIQKRLAYSFEQLLAARENLIQVDLIAYQSPIYQILALSTQRASSAAMSPVSYGDSATRPAASPTASFTTKQTSARSPAEALRRLAEAIQATKEVP